MPRDGLWTFDLQFSFQQTDHVRHVGNNIRDHFTEHLSGHTHNIMTRNGQTRHTAGGGDCSPLQ